MKWDLQVHHGLSEALEKGDLEEFRRLLRESPSNARSEGGGNIWLSTAARNGHLEAIQALVEAGIDINDPASETMPMRAIWWAAGAGHLEVVRWLVEHGAQINFDCEGLPMDIRPLKAAAGKGFLDIVKYLVEQGADFDSHTPAGRQNPLMVAEMGGYHDVAAYLKSLGSRDIREWMPKDFPASRQRMREAMAMYGPLSDFRLLIAGTGDPGIEILATEPHPESGERTVFTLGLSEYELDCPNSEKIWTEIKLFLSRDWPLTQESLADPRWNWPIEWLKRIATETRSSGQWPGLWSAVFMNGEPPQPLAPVTHLCGWLCLLHQGASYQMPDARFVHDRTLFAIYKEEAELIQASGYKELVERFYKHQSPKHIVLERPNVAILPDPAELASPRVKQKIPLLVPPQKSIGPDGMPTVVFVRSDTSEPQIWQASTPSEAAEIELFCKAAEAFNIDDPSTHTIEF